MKGFIAPLLALMMTGMVVGEQPQSSSFQDSQKRSANSSLLGKYLLVMTNEYVRSLKEVGYLSAEIDREGRASIDHVVFHGSDQNSRRTDLEPFSILPLPLSQGDDRLQFLLSDQHLRMMNEYGLMYVIPEQDRGKYSKVLVIYDSPENSTTTTSVAQRPGATQSRQQRDQAASRQQEFIGPRLPADWEYRQNSSRNVDQNQVANNDSFRPRLDPIATRRDATYPYNDRTAYENRQFQGGSDFNQRPLAPQDDNRFANQQNTFEPVRNDPNRNSQDFSNPDQMRRNPTARELGSMGSSANWQNPLGSAQQTVDNRTPRLDPQNDPINQSTLQQQQMRDAKAREVARLQQARLARENEELDAILAQERLDELQRQQRSDRYASTADPLLDRLPTLNEGLPRRTDRGYTDEVYGDSRITDPYQQIPRDRLAAAPRPSNKPPEFSIPGPAQQSDQTTRSNSVVPIDRSIVAQGESDRILKQNAALWFIMLCSIGLNFYLSWISRGFYVRYEELADELRESFTNTMS